LQESGMARQLQEYADKGGTILGICGGFQMLGKTVADSEGIEGEKGSHSGLNLLPVETVITGDKITRQRSVNSVYFKNNLDITGYEIHSGKTQFLESSSYEHLFDDSSLGIVNSDQSIWGCYLHGILDNGNWRRLWLNQIRQKQGLSLLEENGFNYSEQRETELDSLADFVEEYLDLDTIWSAGGVGKISATSPESQNFKTL